VTTEKEERKRNHLFIGHSQEVQSLEKVRMENEDLDVFLKILVWEMYSLRTDELKKKV
jgi:hypothetical protein